MWKKASSVLLLSSLLLVVGCGDTPNADKRQAEETKKRLLDADRQIGMPDITRFTERKLARDILELRDQENLLTYTYLVNLEGDLIYLGESIGFGLPYSVQYTNPEVEVSRYSQGGYGTLPQADPNGLFMPDGLSATWVLLRDPETGEARPVYVEPQIIVSPFKIDAEKRTTKTKT